MSAVEKTSPSQFGWAETTSITQGEEIPGERGRMSRGSVRLNYIDKDTQHATGSGRDDSTFADSHASVSAHWEHEAPRLWSEAEKAAGEDYGEGDHTTHYLADGGIERRVQGALFSTGGDEGPMLEGLSSTRQGRFASARGVGIMANLIERYTGKTIEPSQNLSSNSAPLVEKLTGKPQTVTNDISFSSDPQYVVVPSENRAESVIREGREGTVRRQINRWMKPEEAKAGGQRLKDEMHARRVKPTPMDRPPERFEQQEMFGTLYRGNAVSPSGIEERAKNDKAGRTSQGSSNNAVRMQNDERSLRREPMSDTDAAVWLHSR